MKLTIADLKRLIRESVQDDARAAIDRLEPTNSVSTDILKTPIRVFSGSVTDVAKTVGVEGKILRKAATKARLPTTSLDPKLLQSFQTFVTRYGLERVLDGTRQSQGKQDMPTVFKTLDNQYVVIDGNHRVAAAILSGTDSIVVRVVDVSMFR